KHSVVVHAEGDQWRGAWVSALIILIPGSVKRIDDRAVLDPVESRKVHGGLAVLGRNDDRGLLEQAAVAERAHHAAGGLVHEVQPIAQRRTGSGAVSKVTSSCGSGEVALGPGGRQFLAGRDGLKVHAQQGGSPGIAGAVMAMAVDPVQDGLDFVVVVLL